MAEQGGGLTVIIDDNYIIGPPVIAFETNRTLVEDPREVGFKLNAKKSKRHIDSAFRDDAWEHMRGNIPNGVLKKANGEVMMVNSEPMHKMTVCNVPVGSQDFVEGYLDQRMKTILKGYAKISKLLDPRRWPNPDITTCKMMWMLTTTCI